MAGAVTVTPLGPLTLWRATPWRPRCDTIPGTLVAHERTLAITTGEGLLVPTEVQPESRRAVAWDEYLRGARLLAGACFTSP